MANKKNSKEKSERSFSNSILGTLGILSKNKQKTFNQEWDKFTSFQKARSIINHQEDISLEFLAEDLVNPTTITENETDVSVDVPEMDSEDSQPRPKTQILYEEPVIRRPWFIIFISIVHIIMLCVEIIKNKGFQSFSVNPWFGPSVSVLIDLGAKYEPKMKDGQYYRFVTPIFLHVGILHLLMNLFFQWKGGKQLETTFGIIRTIIIYFVSGIGGVLASTVFLPYMLQVGPSGSLYGIFAVLFCDLFHSWKEIESPRLTLFKMILVIIISFGTGLLPSVDNFAHLGGFLTGTFSGLILLPNIRLRKSRGILVLISFLFLGTYFGVGFYLFFKNANALSSCKFCKYITCLPIKSWCDSVDIPVGHEKTDIE
ncbi:rhomboid-like protein [Anaeramoeba ignava]|uniref:rhomboid protease n=1 Tax=Anaeramoeba ignava TaxID=1746090 RepID=A0A9Q0RBQ7_ANAIG|nr:rhomboid-like protein [Anaeramoeba ignava]